jgi:hypothetical protein
MSAELLAELAGRDREVLAVGETGEALERALAERGCRVTHVSAADLERGGGDAVARRA